MRNAKTNSGLKAYFKNRWSEEDYPGAEPRFHLNLLLKDLVIFILLPLSAVILYKMVEVGVSGSSKKPSHRSQQPSDSRENRSQVISFVPHSSGVVLRSAQALGFQRRSPGTLVRVRLLNRVETLSTAPVHAQIIDGALGRNLIGGAIIGDAVSDSTTGRVTIDFRFVRHPSRSDAAASISARAISLDGTYGIPARKKEGFFARAAVRSAASNNNSVDTNPNGNGDFKTLIARAVASGIMQEFKSDAQTAHNNAQVYELQPMTEFFVELTDFFPGDK